MIKGFALNYEVCSCHKITIDEIVQSIKEKGAKTLGDIQEITRAGTNCRYCILEEGDFGKMKKKIYCKDVLKEVLL